MSTDADKDPACPSASEKSAKLEAPVARRGDICDQAPEARRGDVCSQAPEARRGDACDDETCEKKRQKPSRKVSFPPTEDQLVTQYFEPANPWQDVPPTSREQLAIEYVESCRRHNTQPIQSVLIQIQELPESAIGGTTRAPRLTLDNCSLLTSAPADALESVLKKTQFRRITIDHAEIGDEGAEALFDMFEYYESASTLTINGPRQFGIRGWQAASRMIRKSAELSELEVTSGPIEAGHAPVLARALRPHTCALRSLSLQQTALCGEPLACLVIALRSNSSVRELRLGDNSLSPSDAAQLACLLRANTRLKLLDLSNNNIQDLGVSHIADALVDQAGQTPPSAATSPLSPHQCPVGGYESRGLAFLVLWNNQLTRNCANHIAKAMRSSQSLCVLNIGRNALGTETIRAFKSPGALISLGLQAARLGPDAGRALADLVRARTQLQRLDLRDNKLGNAGLQAILTALKDNNTLIQIDLDDVSESSSTLSAENGGEEASCARLAKEISSLCRRNESASAGEHRVHRKISLTCHTAKCLLRGVQSPEEERRARRLRSPAPSPAPSPAGSPVPGAMPTRFSVTRVTPERESGSSSTDSCSPTTPTRASPSRFRVMQVSEPPQIQVQAAESTPRRSASRFSVTRNTDTIYKLPPKADKGEKPSGNKPSDVFSDKTIKDDSDVANKSNVTANKSEKSDVPVKEDAVSNATIKTDNKSEVHSDKTAVAASTMKYFDKSEEISHDETISNKGDEKMFVQETKLVQNSREVSDKEKVDVKVEVTVKKECVADNSNSQNDSFKHVNIVNNQAPAKVHNDQIKPVIVVVDDKCVIEVNKNDTVSACKEKGNKITSKDVAIKQIEAITHDFENLIHEMQSYSEKSGVLARKSTDVTETKVKNDSTQTDIPGVINITVEKEKDIISKDDNSVPVTLTRDSLVLKKNKSESSLDSPDLEVSRLMNKKPSSSPFFDSSSSLEISGSSMESLNDNNQNGTKINKPMVIQETVEVELDRRKPNDIVLTTEGSIESTASESTPVNSGNFLNTSLSSNESVSPIIFGKNKKIHGSLSSLEASVSSMDSARGTERTMVTSADSGIENSLQNPSESKEDSSSNEGTLTNSSSLKDSVKIPDRPEYLQSAQDTLTSSPKRTSSLLDVPALKSKGLDRMRKISWVAPSASFHIPKPEEAPKVEPKLPTHLEKLLSLFHNPGSLFSRSNEEEKRSATNTPPRKESTSLTTSFWSWGAGVVEKEDILEDRDSSPEITDSTLSERVQISYVDESFSKKLDSKTPSTDTDNTLSEFQSFPIQGNSETSDATDVKIEETVAKVTENVTTDDNLVQKCLDLSLIDTELSSNGNNKPGAVCDKTDLKEPNDFNKNVYDKEIEITSDASQNIASFPEHIIANIDKIDTDKTESNVDFKVEETKSLEARPRSFAAVLKSSGSENSLDRQTSPDNGQSVDKLPNKVIRGIKENISPENTLTSSTTKTLALELSERQIKNQPIINAVWEVTNPVQEKLLPIIDDVNPEIPTELAIPNPIEYTLTRDIDKLKDFIVGSTLHKTIECTKIVTDDPNTSIDSGVTSLEGASDERTVKLQTTEPSLKLEDNIENLELVDLGKDALSYLIYENQDFEVSDAVVPDAKTVKGTVLSEELKDAEKKEQLIDLSPELVIDEVIETEVFNPKEVSGSSQAPAIPDRAKIKKSNSLEDLSQRLLRVCMEPEKEEPKSKPKNIVFKVPECSTTPRDIPDRRPKLRSRSGSSPKSLPESLNKPSPIHKIESITIRKKKVSSLGKMARDSLLALNKTVEDIADIRREYKLTSVESLRSLESVSEDANSQSGTSADSRCKACFRLSQESLMSLDSINEDCRCDSESDKGETSHSAR